MAEAVGLTHPPTPVAWLTRDLLVFANSIGIEKDELVEKSSGGVHTRIVSSSFAVGQGGWGGPKGSLSLHALHLSLASDRANGEQDRGR